MPFTPIFQQLGESQFIDKLMAVVHRDMKPSLDYYDRLEHGGVLVDNFPDFAAMVRGKPGVFQYPLLVLGLERASTRETTSGEWLEKELTSGAGMVVQDTSVDAAQRKAEKYVRAFEAVVITDVLELLPEEAGLVEYTIDIDHRYFAHGTKGTEFTQPVEFAIKIRFGEK